MSAVPPTTAVLVRPSERRARPLEPTGARKPLEAIDIQLTNKPISLLQHKIYNVWVAFAQSTPDPDAVRIFEFPLLEVMDLCGFESNNRAFFIDAAKEMLDLRVEYASLERWAPPESAVDRAGEGGRKPARPPRARSAPAKWAAAQLVSFIEIDSANARMRIEFPEVLREKILRPDFYRVVDLRKQQLFTSRPGLALYEYVLRFAGDRATPWLDWQDYSILLSGGTEPHKTFREFSKVLQRAVDQVNTHHDAHSVLVEFTKQGRAVAKMRIAIEPRADARVPMEVEPDPEIVKSMTALGIAESAARDLARGYTREYVAAQIAYVSRQQRKGRVQTAGAYLRSAIATNYAAYVPSSAPSELAISPAQTAESAPAADTQDLQRLARLAEVRHAIAALTPTAREQLLAKFIPGANPMVRRSHAKSRGDVLSPLVLQALCDWVLETQLDLAEQ